MDSEAYRKQLVEWAKAITFNSIEWILETIKSIVEGVYSELAFNSIEWILRRINEEYARNISLSIPLNGFTATMTSTSPSMFSTSFQFH